jgi:2'-5' RNA ligase
LFTAIDLHASVRERIAAEQQRLLAELRAAPLRWVRPEHLHLTLVFIGDVADDVAATIVNVMRRDISQRPFQIEFAGFGVFPPRGAPRALWLGVRKGSDDVVAVQQRLAVRLHEVGVPLEGRPFTPHLTLARWRGRGGRASERPRSLIANRESIATADVGAVTLFQSRLSSQGPTYTVLAESPLVGSSLTLH